MAQLGTTSYDVNFPAALKPLQFVILLMSLFNVTVALALFVVVFVHFFLPICVCVFIYIHVLLVILLRSLILLTVI